MGAPIRHHPVTTFWAIPFSPITNDLVTSRASGRLFIETTKLLLGESVSMLVGIRRR
jgi:hypothetical protein